jgi:hypothetical protein
MRRRTKSSLRFIGEVPVNVRLREQRADGMGEDVFAVALGRDESGRPAGVAKAIVECGLVSL